MVLDNYFRGPQVLVVTRGCRDVEDLVNGADSSLADGFSVFNRRGEDAVATHGGGIRSFHSMVGARIKIRGKTIVKPKYSKSRIEAGV